MSSFPIILVVVLFVAGLAFLIYLWYRRYRQMMENWEAVADNLGLEYENQGLRRHRLSGSLAGTPVRAYTRDVVDRTGENEYHTFFRGELPEAIEQFYDHDGMPDPSRRLIGPGTDYEIEDGTVTLHVDHLVRGSRPVHRHVATVAEFCEDARTAIQAGDGSEADQ